MLAGTNPPQVPVAHWMHLWLSLMLFAANLAATQLISNDKFIGRLKYVGHEMAFLACGIGASRLYIARSGDHRAAVLFVLIFFIFVWLLTLMLTKKVLSNAPLMLTPLIGSTLLLGAVSVLLAVGGYAEDWAILHF